MTTDHYAHHRDTALLELDESTNARTPIAVERSLHRAQIHATLALAAATHDQMVTVDLDEREDDAPELSGVGLIAAERHRQIAEEGYSLERDATHVDDELAIAAACYATPPAERDQNQSPPPEWPWLSCYWKPTPHDRVRELVKAGALIAAEIDRLRAAQASALAFDGGTKGEA